MIRSVRLEWQGGRVSAAAALLLAVSADPVAAADPIRVPARLEWGTSVCGDAEGFPSRVLKRTQRVRFVERGEDLAVFLSIQPQGTGLDARVEMKTSAGRQIVNRSIASPDCDDALDALALVVAISLEGRAHELERARSAPRPTPPRKRFPPAASPEPAPAPAPPQPEPAPLEPAPAAAELPTEPSSPSPEPVAQPEPSPPPQPEPTPEPPPAPPPAVVVEPPPAAPEQVDVPAQPEPGAPRTGLWLGVGVDAEMALSVAPRPMLGAGLWLEATWERESWLSPSTTLGASHVRLNAYEQQAGKADFQLNTFRLELCPVRAAAGPFELRPCVTGASGDFKISGYETFGGRNVLARWAALGAVLRGVARLGPVELRTAIGAEVPHDRDWFRFGQDCTEIDCEDGVFHRVGAFATRLEIGAGVSF